MVRKNVAEILQNHVTFELEAIDRMYLNGLIERVARTHRYRTTTLGARMAML